MCRMKLKVQVVAFLALTILCMPALTAQAEGPKTWPVETDLITPDPVVDTPDAAMKVGTVTFKNSNSNYIIEVFPDDPYRISDIAIHVVEASSEGEFRDALDDLIDKKGKPKTGKFDYKKDFLGDGEEPSDYYYQLVSLDNFYECWAQNLEACPGLYTIVVASLVEFIDGEWVNLPDSAYAEESGTFADLDSLGERNWLWYLTYQRARALAGHFVDANVNGLTYETFTQYGTTEFSTDSGTTGVEGQFWFLPGEQIKFWVGDLFLGETLADRRLDPTDLFMSSDLDDHQVVNMARLLQSLDKDGMQDRGAINISDAVKACLNGALTEIYGENLPTPEALFGDGAAVETLIDETIDPPCSVELTKVSYEDARENLNSGMQAGNLMKRNISKTPEMLSDKAKIEIVPVYVPSQDAKGYLKDVVYYDADGVILETRDKAKPIVVSYLDEIGYSGAHDVWVAISRDDGDTWKRRNVSRTADKTSVAGYPGHSQKPMLKVKGNKIFVAWTDKYCHGGRPHYAITTCDVLDVDSDDDGEMDTCNICRETDEGTKCMIDYPGDDGYWMEDMFGVSGPHRTVTYEEYPELGEVAYSCVWTSRAVVESDGNIQWFKPERVTSGRRDAYQLFAAAGTDAGFAIVWQEDPKGLMTGEGHGPGDGWSGANTHNKSDIWYSYITLGDFGIVDESYPSGNVGYGEDMVDTDPDMVGRLKAKVPMSLPVRITDNDVCSLENMDPDGGHGDHDFDGEGQGTHRYCGSYDDVVDATEAAPSTSPLCAYTIEKANPHGEIHHVCVTADGRLLDGNTGSSRANVFLQPDKYGNTWAIVGYEESKGVGSPPDHDDGCGDEATESTDSDHDDRYKPDMGKNVIYHSFEFTNPETVASGEILNLPETDAFGDIVYLVNEDGTDFLDWKGDKVEATENARRIRFVSQPAKNAGASGTVLVALYRQGEEGGGKPADIFMRRVIDPDDGDNPYAFKNFESGARNLSSVTPTELWTDPYDSEAPEKMLRWGWTHDNLGDKSAANPYTDSRAHRGALSGDELIVGYIWTPNWGRRGNDKYDFYVRRSFNGGQGWTTDPASSEDIEHHVVFRVPVLDPDTQTVSWENDVVTTSYDPGAAEPPRNVSNLRNNRASVLEPRLVKTPGSIKTTGAFLYPEDKRKAGTYQLAYGIEFNQNQLPYDTVYPKIPLDIYYSRTKDKGQRYESVVVTPQGGNGQPEEGWNMLAKDQPEQGAVQVRQTPDGSRMYGIWLEESDGGSDIMFRRVDYR